MFTDNAIRIDIVPVGRGRWDAFWGPKKIASGKTDPGFAACRTLEPRGVSGFIEIWHRGAEYPSMLIDITKGAKLTVADGGAAGTRFVKWRPFVRSDESGFVRSACTGAAPRWFAARPSRPRTSHLQG